VSVQTLSWSPNASRICASSSMPAVMFSSRDPLVSATAAALARARPIAPGFVGDHEQRFPAVGGTVDNAVGEVWVYWPGIAFRTPLGQLFQDRLGLLCAVAMPIGLNFLIRCAAAHVDEDRARC